MPSDRSVHQLRKLSRFLSLLLRHRPARFPIHMDDQGYADLDEVMHFVRGLPNFRWATYSDIDAVLDLPGRQRFERVRQEDGPTLIRALYGHTAVRPTYEPAEPPPVLYHGTAPETVPAIRRDGLHPMERQYVHLSVDAETARRTGLRHAGDAVVLEIDAAAAHDAGIAFYHPVEEIFLCDHVPPDYIRHRSPKAADR